MNAWKRREVFGDATLYLGDCLAIMPELGRVDCVVTDPPYGIEGGSGGDAKDYRKGCYDAAFEDSPEYIRTVVVPAISRWIGNAEAIAVTPGIRAMFLYPQPADMGCFWTPAGATHGPWGMVTFHPILYYGKDWRAGKGALPSGTKVTERAEPNGHPCPKPIDSWSWLLQKVARPGAMVLDPFMGSGTTGVACVNLGRKFIGIEIEEKYFDIACRRIDLAARQERLPLEAL